MSIVWAIIIFAAVVFVHELGHFVSARIFGIKVLEFAIGMGPAVWKKEKNGTLYSLRIIPIGGCCKMEGEDCESLDAQDFNKQPWYAKLIVLCAGGIMNVLLGYFVCAAAIIVNKKHVPINLLSESFRLTIYFSHIIFRSLGTLITGRDKISELSGALGMLGAISQSAKQGIDNLLLLTSFITINLGIFNLLPFPALDGGRVVFVLFEAIFKKSISPEKEGVIHFIGFSLLILLMLFVSYHDILRLIKIS